MPSGVRKPVYVLLCLAAVVALGWWGRETWLTVEARQQIDDACGGLVPAERVLSLSPAGGTLTHRDSEEGTIDLDDGLPQNCEIFSTEAGEAYGTNSGERWFFTGAMGVLPAGPQVADDPLDVLLDPHGGPTHPYQPLRGGITGIVTDSGVVVELPCAEGEADERPVTALWARAELMVTKPPFSENGQLTDHDRDVLAGTAVTTANNLADRLGCADRLPDPPENIPALPEGPVPASRAEGTCAWYREGDFARSVRFPDQVLQSRTDDRLWDERCVLVLGAERAAGLYNAEVENQSYLPRPTAPGQWFVSLHTYSGERARNVLLTSTYGDEKPEPARPGGAGRSSEDPVWWASSVCAGQPQIHTMTLGLGYDQVIPAEIKKVFRAYVTDVTERRGCTDVVLPKSSDFPFRPA
ncbi:hypothetical protein ACWFQ6_31600 [Streptomyces althioticus]